MFESREGDSDTMYSLSFSQTDPFLDAIFSPLFKGKFCIPGMNQSPFSARTDAMDQCLFPSVADDGKGVYFLVMLF